MPGFIPRPHGEDLDFELFSNVVLKFTAILMVVLVLLAINVGQRLDQIISPYRFSGGLARPELYIAAYDAGNYREAPKMQVALFSASYANASTAVDPVTHQLIIRKDTETVSGRFIGSPNTVLALLSGILPGSIPIDGKQTPLIVPIFANKTLMLFDKDNTSHIIPQSEQLARSFLKIWSGAYSNPVYPTRAFSEYKDVRTRIYVETSNHDFVIGNRVLTAAQIKDGQLDFLTSLSSTNTEFVYLGEYTSNAAAQTDTRLEFYEKNGFAEAAKIHRTRLYPDAADMKLAKEYYDRETSWDQLPAEKQSSLLKGAKGDAKRAREQYDLVIARNAIANYRNSLVEDAIKRGVKPDPSALPEGMAYPDAWQAYVDFRMKADPTPPEWFITDLLQPLGFDKRVMIVGQ